MASAPKPVGGIEYRLTSQSSKRRERTVLALMRKKILIVEDDEATRGLLSTLLERNGYDVVGNPRLREQISNVSPSAYSRPTKQGPAAG